MCSYCFGSLTSLFGASGILDINLAPGEYTDYKPALIIDYTQSFGDRCTTPPGSIFGQNELSLNFLGQLDLTQLRQHLLKHWKVTEFCFVFLSDNIYPFRLIIDVVRVVGRQSDGGLIYLGKTYMQDPFRSDHQAYNIAFWSVVNYDPVVTTLKPGESLRPLVCIATALSVDIYMKNCHLIRYMSYAIMCLLFFEIGTIVSSVAVK